MNLTKKILIVLSVCLIVAAAALALVFFVVFKPQKPQEEATVVVQDMQLQVGQSAQINFTLNKTGYTVKFSVVDTSVASVDGQVVLALKEGTTFLKAVATNGSAQYIALSQIVVIKPADEGSDNDKENNPNPDNPQNPDNNPQDPVNPKPVNYTYMLYNLVDCQLEGNTLVAKVGAFFSIQIYADGKAVDGGDCTAVATRGITLEKDLGIFTFTSVKPGEIRFEFKSLDYVFSIAVMPQIN